MRPALLLLTAALFTWAPAGGGAGGPAAAQVQPGQTVRGNVLKVMEGDTYEVIRSFGPRPTFGQVFTVRLWGVDAPEPGQPYGAVATRAARQLIGENRVEIVVETVTEGGVVARVRVEGEDLAETLLRAGLAWHDPRRAPFVASLKQLEQSARTDGSGLWSQPEPVPPWEWSRTGPLHPAPADSG